MGNPKCRTRTGTYLGKSLSDGVRRDLSHTPAPQRLSLFVFGYLFSCLPTFAYTSEVLCVLRNLTDFIFLSTLPTQPFFFNPSRLPSLTPSIVKRMRFFRPVVAHPLPRRHFSRFQCYTLLFNPRSLSSVLSFSDLRPVRQVGRRTVRSGRHVPGVLLSPTPPSTCPQNIPVNPRPTPLRLTVVIPCLNPFRSNKVKILEPDYYHDWFLCVFEFIWYSRGLHVLTALLLDFCCSRWNLAKCLI